MMFQNDISRKSEKGVAVRCFALLGKDLKWLYGCKKNGLEIGINRVKKGVQKCDGNRDERHLAV